MIASSQTRSDHDYKIVREKFGTDYFGLSFLTDMLTLHELLTQINYDH